jgi:hypothetical protein
MKRLPAGANVLRWNCSDPERGCFNVKRRPKIEYFYDCFPGRIAMGDVDGVVEINWNFLYLEWKGFKQDPSGGQRIMSERRTCGGESTVFYVVGDAETMEVSHLGIFWRGKWLPLTPCTFDQLKARISSWARWAKSHPHWPGISKSVDATRTPAPTLRNEAQGASPQLQSRSESFERRRPNGDLFGK